MQAVRAAFVLLAPRANKFSIRIKHYDRVLNFCILADGVLDVDFALRVHGDAVCVAINVAGGQFAPVVEAFVLMVAGAEDGRTRAGFVLRNDVRRSGETRRRRGRFV